jgi:hypothetical protein
MAMAEAYLARPAPCQAGLSSAALTGSGLILTSWAACSPGTSLLEVANTSITDATCQERISMRTPGTRSLGIVLPPTDVTTTLADTTNWSSTAAGQVIGLQWQLTGTGVDGDAGASCPVDVTITNIKFVE